MWSSLATDVGEIERNIAKAFEIAGNFVPEIFFDFCGGDVILEESAGVNKLWYNYQPPQHYVAVRPRYFVLLAPGLSMGTCSSSQSESGCQPMEDI